MKDYLDIFNESYARVTGFEARSDDFFSRFYESFISKSVAISEKFKDTDMETQKEMLKTSIIFMLNFYIHKKSSDYMNKLAIIHSKKGRDIQPAHYDIWLDSVIDALKECDKKFNRDVEIAWRIILSPGITFMKFHYDQDVELNTLYG